MSGIATSTLHMGSAFRITNAAATLCYCCAAVSFLTSLQVALLLTDSCFLHVSFGSVRLRMTVTFSMGCLICFHFNDLVRILLLPSSTIFHLVRGRATLVCSIAVMNASWMPCGVRSKASGPPPAGTNPVSPPPPPPLPPPSTPPPDSQTVLADATPPPRISLVLDVGRAGSCRLHLRILSSMRCQYRGRFSRCSTGCSCSNFNQ